jgi:hypothetical protein
MSRMADVPMVVVQSPVVQVVEVVQGVEVAPGTGGVQVVPGTAVPVEVVPGTAVPGTAVPGTGVVAALRAFCDCSSLHSCCDTACMIIRVAKDGALTVSACAFGSCASNTLAAKSSGVMFGVGFLILSNCWITRTPGFLSVVLSIFSVCASILMNTLEWSIVCATDSSVHMRAMLLTSACYFVFFVQGGYMVWQSVESSQEDACRSGGCNCAATEGWYVVFVIIGASILRFVEPLMRENCDSHRRRYIAVAPPDYAYDIFAIITAAALIVSALLLQTFAVFGRLGNVSTFLVPVPYALMFPCLIGLRTAAYTELSGCFVLTNFSECSSVAVHMFCSIWPLVLYSGDRIDGAQTVMTFVGNVCIMLACQLVICVMDPRQTTRDNGLHFL